MSTQAQIASLTASFRPRRSPSAAGVTKSSRRGTASSSRTRLASAVSSPASRKRPRPPRSKRPKSPVGEPSGAGHLDQPPGAGVDHPRVELDLVLGRELRGDADAVGPEHAHRPLRDRGRAHAASASPRRGRWSSAARQAAVISRQSASQAGAPPSTSAPSSLSPRTSSGLTSRIPSRSQSGAHCR